MLLCVTLCSIGLFFFFKQKTAYEMRISDWSSDVCSSDLLMSLAERIARSEGAFRGVRQRLIRPRLMSPIGSTFVKAREEFGQFSGLPQSRRSESHHKP